MTTVTARDRNETADRRGTGFERLRSVILAAATLRAVLAAVAIPLAPFLVREHVAVLVLLRPTKEVLLLAGFVLRRGDVSLPAIVVAALPVLLGGVWVLFALGRAYADDIEDATRSGLVRRLLPPKRLRRLTDAIGDHGTRFVFLGRLAAFPSSLVGAAAGVSGVPTRAFLLADAAGALLSGAVLVAVGYGLGEAYDEAGTWVTAAGVVVLGAVVVVLGRTLLKPREGRRR